MAGAAKELSEALIINPVSYKGISDAIKNALQMPAEEQLFRMSRMQKKIKKSDVQLWAQRFLSDLDNLKNQKLEEVNAFDKGDQIFSAYKEGKKRLILLDYDGTLVGFKKRPEEAIPDSELLELIRELQKSPKNDVYIISGRDQKSLGRWFKDIPVKLISEHGAFFRNTEGEWEDYINYDLSWIPGVRKLLETFTD